LIVTLTTREIFTPKKLISDTLKNLTLEKLVTVVKNANELYDHGQYEESIWWYDQAISINPTNIGALYNKASVKVKLGKHHEALQLYDKVLEIDSGNVSALYNKAHVLVNLDKHLEAISCYEKIVQIDPTNIPALYNKRLALEKVGKHYGIGLTTVKQLL